MKFNLMTIIEEETPKGRKVIVRFGIGAYLILSIVPIAAFLILG